MGCVTLRPMLDIVLYVVAGLIFAVMALWAFVALLLPFYVVIVSGDVSNWLSRLGQPGRRCRCGDDED